ncbi:hypothetical protein [Muricoccus nepalensis]|uniref:hypothetical protein n=1 Tax=Muricoccus nepalensis TaxID=1854500 RepID=UPI00112BCEB3|nr:hypothetical protein [Roseomonas nepalensis]
MAKSIPFSFYHGTSSYFLDLFTDGVPSCNWPYEAAAKAFVEEAANTIKHIGLRLEWFEEDVLQQKDHWRHGKLYVSPCKRTAAEYAWSNAQYGGEYINIGVNILQNIRAVNNQQAENLIARYRNTLPMLEGHGRPLVLEISELMPEFLLPERENNFCATIEDVINDAIRYDVEVFEAIHQQSNFQLIAGKGNITRVLEIIHKDRNECFVYQKIDLPKILD